MPEFGNTSVYLGELEEKIDARGTGSRSEYVRGALRMRLELTEAAEAAGIADELDDDWWRDWLYDAAREELDERRERALADEGEREEIEADD